MKIKLIKAYEGRQDDYSHDGTDLGVINIEAIDLVYEDGSTEDGNITDFAYIENADNSFNQMLIDIANTYHVTPSMVRVIQFS